MLAVGYEAPCLLDFPTSSSTLGRPTHLVETEVRSRKKPLTPTFISLNLSSPGSRPLRTRLVWREVQPTCGTQLDLQLAELLIQPARHILDQYRRHDYTESPI